ncbi:MAG TPA: carotenoid biosynthesis protein [Verrucomicrobiae bacterium]|jgi:uncharacterized membrane protein|nr:carotenoid biosynthesis protein [Verrucomicrobiae bacterium]
MIPLSQPLDRPAKDASLALAKYCGWICFGLFLATFVLVAASVARPQTLPPGVITGAEGFLIFFTAVTTLFAMSRHLPLQNVLLATAIIAVIGSVVTWVGLKTSVPFGPFIYGEQMQPRVGGLPLVIPFIWVIAVLNSRGVARLVLRPWRKTRKYGYWVIGFTIVICVMLDMGWEIFLGPVKHYVLWGQTRLAFSWNGVPLINFLGWILTLLLMLAFSTPVMINKRRTRSNPDYHPLIVWVLLNALFALGAGRDHMWSAVIAIAIYSVLVIGFAVRGARW